MPFQAIAGTFRIKGYSPDGDSIRFHADDPDAWKTLDGRPARPNARGDVQLRLEAIDALETHYEGHHQPLAYAEKAARVLFAALGITDVEWDNDHQQVTQANDNTPGFILARMTGTYGRPVSFLFTREAGQSLGLTDGSAFTIKPEQLDQTANLALVDQGLVYPTFYSGLFSDLRQHMVERVQSARDAGTGFWPQDQTNSGVAVDDLASITEKAVILPKLFRRLIEYLGSGGSIDGFKAFLAKNPDAVMVLPRAHFTHLDNLIEVDGDVVRLTQKPEELVFMEG